MCDDLGIFSDAEFELQLRASPTPSLAELDASLLTLPPLQKPLPITSTSIPCQFVSRTEMRRLVQNAGIHKTTAASRYPFEPLYVRAILPNGPLPVPKRKRECTDEEEADFDCAKPGSSVPINWSTEYGIHSGSLFRLFAPGRSSTRW